MAGVGRVAGQAGTGSGLDEQGGSGGDVVPPEPGAGGEARLGQGEADHRLARRWSRPFVGRDLQSEDDVEDRPDADEWGEPRQADDVAGLGGPSIGLEAGAAAVGAAPVGRRAGEAEGRLGVGMTARVGRPVAGDDALHAYAVGAGSGSVRPVRLQPRSRRYPQAGGEVPVGRPTHGLEVEQPVGAAVPADGDGVVARVVSRARRSGQEPGDGHLRPGRPLWGGEVDLDA